MTKAAYGLSVFAYWALGEWGCVLRVFNLICATYFSKHCHTFRGFVFPIFKGIKRTVSPLFRHCLHRYCSVDLPFLFLYLFNNYPSARNHDSATGVHVYAARHLWKVCKNWWRPEQSVQIWSQDVAGKGNAWNDLGNVHPRGHTCVFTICCKIYKFMCWWLVLVVNLQNESSKDISSCSCMLLVVFKSVSDKLWCLKFNKRCQPNGVFRLIV